MYPKRRNPVSSATPESLRTNKRPACSLTRSRPPVASESSRTSSAALCARDHRWIAHSPTCAGDTLVVWKLDRLGRSLRNLLEIAETLHDRDVALRSLTEHIDTATAAGKMLYSVLGAVAQFERDVLRERTVAAIRAAQARGEHVGRPPALTPTQVREAKKMIDRGESPNHVARILRVGRSTLYRHLG